MIQFRENNFVPFFQIKYEYIKYIHVTCVELWFVFFSRIKNWHLEGSKKRSCTRVFIACVASVSVWFRSKERPRNGILGFGRARLVPRSLLQNRTETIATQATESSRFLLEAERLWIRDWMGRSKRGCMRTQILPVCTCHHSGHVDCQELGSGNSKNSSQKIYIYFVGHQPPGHQHGYHFILLAN